jgi:uncharacterized protein with HEPN domain
MKLTEESIYFIEEAIKYAKHIQKFSQLSNPTYQNAVIFCLKAIGTCVHHAVYGSATSARMIQNISAGKFPKSFSFFGDIYYLRNALTHNFNSFFVKGSTVSHIESRYIFECLVKIRENIGQVIEYFNILISIRNTDIEEKFML